MLIKVEKNVRRGCTKAFERPSAASLEQVQSREAQEVIHAVIEEFELLTERADLPAIDRRFKGKACCATFLCLVAFVALCSSTMVTVATNERMEKYWNVREVDKITDQYFKHQVEQANVEFFEKQATNPDIWQPLQQPEEARALNAYQYAELVKQTFAFASYSQKLDSILRVNLYNLDLVKMFLEAERLHLQGSTRYAQLLAADRENLLAYEAMEVRISGYLYAGAAALILLLVAVRCALKAAKFLTLTRQSRVAEKLIKSDNQRLRPYGLYCIVNHELTQLTFVSSSHLQVLGGRAPEQVAAYAYNHYPYPMQAAPQVWISPENPFE